LPGKRPAAIVRNGHGHHNRDAASAFREEFLKSEKGSLGVNCVEHGFYQKQIYTAIHEPSRLLIVGINEHIERRRTECGIIHIR
jgi:hypothetical protein